jgi:hypothetical protein
MRLVSHINGHPTSQPPSAAPQLVRWESRHGWTRSGWGRVSHKETSLASVLARMLRAPDAWAGFADRYLDALDRLARAASARRDRFWDSTSYERDRRTADLAAWRGSPATRACWTSRKIGFPRVHRN